MHTRDEQIGKRAWAKICGDAVIDAKPRHPEVPHEVGQLCDVCGSKSEVTH